MRKLLACLGLGLGLLIAGAAVQAQAPAAAPAAAAAEVTSAPAAAIGSDARRAFYTNPPDGKNLGKSTVVVGLKYNF